MELFAQEPFVRASESSLMRSKDAATVPLYQSLYAYIDAELDGENAAEQFPEIHAAVQSSGELQEEYQALHELLLAQRQENLTTPPPIASFDFSYLASTSGANEPETSTAKPWHLNQLGQLVIEFSAELIQSLQPPMQLAGVKSGEKGGGGVFLAYTLEGEVEDVAVEIAARELRDEPERCNVALFVDVPSRGGWPNLAGSSIILRDRDGAATEQMTDAFGRTLFRGVDKDALARLSFEIAPVGWQARP